MKNKNLLTGFDLGRELETAGEFLYDAVKNFAKLDSLARQYEVNYILFHASIGIERLQKLLLFLKLGNDAESYKAQEADFRTWSHEKLHGRIAGDYGIRFGNEELHFLTVLSDYYREYRYSVYELPNTRPDLRLLIMQFFNIQLKLTVDYEKDYIKYKSEICALFGKTVGRIIRTYYAAIKEKAKSVGLTSEIDKDTIAYPLFNKETAGDDLTALAAQSIAAQKELMLLVRRADGGGSFTEFLDNIEPLALDPGAVNDYLSEIYKNGYSEKLTSAVDALYAKMDGEKLRIRKELISLIGDKAYFDFVGSVGK